MLDRGRAGWTIVPNDSIDSIVVYVLKHDGFRGMGLAINNLVVNLKSLRTLLTVSLLQSWFPKKTYQFLIFLRSLVLAVIHEAYEARQSRSFLLLHVIVMF
jgi:hypothetical protein